MSTNLTALVENGDQKVDINTETNAIDVSVIDSENQIFDLYAVGHAPEHVIQPFIHQLNIEAKDGSLVEVLANFDEGALANTMSVSKFNSIKNQLGCHKPSSR